jgi:hypothetical protein
MSGPVPVTLGLLLASDARRRILGYQPRLDWLRHLRPVLERAAGHPMPERFRRVERVPQTPAHTPPAAVRPAPGAPLSSDLLERLRAVCGVDATTLRVHADHTADGIARHERADAVTIGADVFFRAGTRQPHEDDGFALLAHETVHVGAATAPGAGWRRASASGRAEEEAAALAAEAAARRRGRIGAALPAPAPVSWPLPASAPVPRPAPVPAPGAGQAAARDREWPLAAQAAPVDQFAMAALRRQIHQDLLAEIRSDFERGA